MTTISGKIGVLLFGMVASSSVLAAPLTIPASQMGRFNNVGANAVAPDATANLIGELGGSSGGPISFSIESRGFLNFDLSGVSGVVKAATLRISIASYTSQKQHLDTSDPTNPVCTLEPTPSLGFSVNNVTTPLPTLLADYPLTGFPPLNHDGQAVFTELGTYQGTHFSVTTGDVGKTIDIPLSAAALASINNAVGSNVSFALDFQGHAAPQFIFCQRENFEVRLNTEVASQELILETEPPLKAKCDVEMSQPSYSYGDVIGLSKLEVSATGSGAIPSEVKTWMEMPDGAEVSIVRAGGDGSVVIFGGTSQDWAPQRILGVDANTQKGDYKVGCRILNPTTGAYLNEDVANFTVN